MTSAGIYRDRNNQYIIIPWDTLEYYNKMNRSNITVYQALLALINLYQSRYINLPVTKRYIAVTNQQMYELFPNSDATTYVIYLIMVPTMLKV